MATAWTQAAILQEAVTWSIVVAHGRAQQHQYNIAQPSPEHNICSIVDLRG